MRKLPAILALLAYCSQITLAHAQVYKDVNNTRYATAVAYLDQKNVISGSLDGRIRPYDQVNRAEALKIILTAQERFGSELNVMKIRAPRLPLFTDVRNSDWFNAYIELGFQKGIVKGYADGTFRPAKSVTVAEGLALLARSEGWSVPASRSGIWYEPFITQANERNLLSNNEQWNAGSPLTRGQLMDIVYRSHTVRTQSLVAFQDQESIQNPQPQPVVTYGPTTSYQQPGRIIDSSYIAPRTTQPVQPLGNVITSSNQPTRVATTTSTTPAPPQATVSAGGPGYSNVFTISIPALGISNMNVGHPTDVSPKGTLAPLGVGVGHLYALPGGNGKILVYGHSSNYTWDKSVFAKIFRTINKLKAGDRVTINYKGQTYTYEVTGQQVIKPTDTSAFSGVGEELILYTCWPPDKIDTRLLVRAKRV